MNLEQIISEVLRRVFRRWSPPSGKQHPAPRKREPLQRSLIWRHSYLSQNNLRAIWSHTANRQETLIQAIRTKSVSKSRRNYSTSWPNEKRYRTQACPRTRSRRAANLEAPPRQRTGKLPWPRSTQRRPNASLRRTSTGRSEYSKVSPQEHSFKSLSFSISSIFESFMPVLISIFACIERQ